MFAKFFVFVFVISLLGITSATIYSPTRATAPLPKTSLSSVEKVVSNKQIEDGDKKADFSQLKSDTLTPKSATKVDAIKVPPKDSEKKSTVTKENPPEVKVVKVSSATSSPLSAVNLNFTTNNPVPFPPVNFEKINESVRKALVNIICTSLSGGYFNALSGSGIIIDPRGIILANAHVAQYLLLKNYQKQNFIDCVARIGSPAVSAYTLSLVYISPSWVKTNYKNIRKEGSLGTGEDDFALLKITGPTNTDNVLPSSFPFVQIDFTESEINSGRPVLIAGYPAGFLGGIAIQRDLYAVSSIVNIGKLYTFKTNTLDAFSLGGSPVAQKGSSGGGVVGANGKLEGIIVTSTDASSTDNRDLDAISISHINRSLFAETGQTLNTLLSGDIEGFAESFKNEKLPELYKLLTDELDSKTVRD